MQEYINTTAQDVSGVVKEWLDETLAGLPKNARILELGSAFGRDASYIQNLGYSVACTDATRAFVNLLQEKGFNARQLDAINDNLDGPYDLVLANAVLLHFTREETEKVLCKVLGALSENGIFAFTLKQGEDEKWSYDKLGAPRFFCFWIHDQIYQLVKNTGFVDVKISGYKATAHNTWLQIIARKLK